MVIHCHMTYMSVNRIAEILEKRNYKISGQLVNKMISYNFGIDCCELRALKTTFIEMIEILCVNILYIIIVVVIIFIIFLAFFSEVWQ